MRSIKIVIIDYGVGNTYSVANALRHLGYNKVTISSKESDIKNAHALILPGVGAFDEAMRNLESRNLHEILSEEVLVARKPILGICVGMQMLATISEENGLHKGLGWIDGRVTKLKLPANYAVPHVGWNSVITTIQSPLFNLNTGEVNFYFDHSYWFECDEKYMAAWCDYGIKVSAAVQHNNIFGVQFHPENSQTSGLKLFRSFFNSVEQC